MDFGRRFGELTVHPFAPNEGKNAPELIKFRNDETNAAVRHRRLALRRDVPRRAADGDHPVRQGSAGGRRRHHVRQHVGGLRRPERPDAAVHLRARGHPRLEAVPGAVRAEPGGPQEAAALRAAISAAASPGGAHPSGVGPQSAVRQSAVHDRASRIWRSAESRALLDTLFHQALHSGISVPPSLGAAHHRHVGQPLDPALRGATTIIRSAATWSASPFAAAR